MSIWGVLAGVGVGVVSGNPVLGTAAAGAIDSATGGGGSAGTCAGQPTQEMAWLLSVVSPEDRAKWIAFNQTIDVSADRVWTVSIQTNNATRLAFEMAGGDDCKCTTQGCKDLRDYALNLLARYQADTGLPPTPTRVVSPTAASSGPVTQAIVTGVTAAAESLQRSTQPVPRFDPLLIGALVIAAFILFK